MIGVLKKIFHSLWISVSCVAVMILTASLIGAFYVTVAFRKIFIKEFTPNALRDSIDDEKEDDAPIESARSHLNAIQATLDKTEAQGG